MSPLTDIFKYYTYCNKGMTNKIICKVRQNKTNKQKSVTIPKEAKEIEARDYVEVKKIK